MDLGLAGKRALITGGTRGIGRAIVDRLVDEGVRVAFSGRKPEGVEARLATLRERGGDVIGEAFEVTDKQALTRFVENAAQAMGGIDIVVPCVSGSRTGPSGDEGWRFNFDIDLLAVVHTVDAALPFLEKQGGAIAFINSVAAIESISFPHPYNTMKAALLTYAGNLSKQVVGKGVRVNSVTAGPIYAEDGVWGVVERNNPERFQQTRGGVPMGRMGEPPEVADTVVFLCSPRSGFTTGANVVIDGGISRRVNF